MIKTIEKTLDPKLDYIGQSFSTRLMNLIFVVGYSISFLIGLIKRDLFFTLVLGVATNIAVVLLVIPAWPYFRRNPFKFKKAKSE